MVGEFDFVSAYNASGVLTTVYTPVGKAEQVRRVGRWDKGPVMRWGALGRCRWGRGCCCGSSCFVTFANLPACTEQGGDCDGRLTTIVLLCGCCLVITSLNFPFWFVDYAYCASVNWFVILFWCVVDCLSLSCCKVLNSSACSAPTRNRSFLFKVSVHFAQPLLRAIVPHFLVRPRSIRPVRY